MRAVESQLRALADLQPQQRGRGGRNSNQGCAKKSRRRDGCVKRGLERHGSYSRYVKW